MADYCPTQEGIFLHEVVGIIVGEIIAKSPYKGQHDVGCAHEAHDVGDSDRPGAQKQIDTSLHHYMFK